MLAKRFRENSRSFRCGFKVKGHGHGEENGWNPMAKLYFGEENIRTVFKFHKKQGTGGIVRWLKNVSRETMTRTSICI